MNRHATLRNTAATLLDITNHPLCRNAPIQGVGRWMAWQIGPGWRRGQWRSILLSPQGCSLAPA